VTSGKGGVGKSTLSANLAVALAQRGKEVGILDADVHGYSIPQMLDVDQRPVTLEGMMIPPVAHGIRVMSIGFFLEEDSPVMWRGPMLHKVIEQFLGDVHWGEIEYLVVDMPPGTGDAAISLGQLLPGAEVLVVTTPQRAAQKVAQRAAVMTTKMDQHLLGVVENMTGGLPGDEADTDESLFGSGGGQLLADSVDAPLIATITLDSAIRKGGDLGSPVALDPDSAAGDMMRDLAEAILNIEAPAPPPPPPEARIKKPLPLL
jgi:ATP-binding protein involved in chromosome partitioning